MVQRSVSAREANQQFSRILRDVEAGAEILVTRRGQPVARIVPAAPPPRERQLTPAQEAALERTRRRLEKGWDLGVGKLDREELYDEILAR
jgi:prevent-host-death family protein